MGGGAGSDFLGSLNTVALLSRVDQVTAQPDYRNRALASEISRIAIFAVRIKNRKGIDGIAVAASQQRGSRGTIARLGLDRRAGAGAGIAAPPRFMSLNSKATITIAQEVARGESLITISGLIVDV